MNRTPVIRHLIKALFLSGVLTLAGCATLDRAMGGQSLNARVTAVLARKGPQGTRFGLLVTDSAGHELVAINPEQRFMPASNTKLFTTAAAFDRLDVKAPTEGAYVALEPNTDKAEAPNIVLVGRGDAMLADRPDCVRDCLSALADAVAKSGLKRIGRVIGDDRLFVDERWGPGWAVDDMETRFGAAVSALTVNDNLVHLDVMATEAGKPVTARWREGDDYLDLINEARTLNPGEASLLELERPPGSRSVRLIGGLAANEGLQPMVLAVEDPAHFAAWRLTKALQARGIEIAAAPTARHRLHTLPEAFPPELKLPPLASLTAPPLIDDLTLTNKQSLNLHAEIMLRRLSVTYGGTGAAEDGLKIVREAMAAAGTDPEDQDLLDGSGMSAYNRVTPRLMVRFLNWTQTQAWGQAWRDTLPTGGVDGSLRRRFIGPLKGKVFAKTGRLMGVNSLSGFLIANSGRRLTFAAFANDRPLMSDSANPAIDAALELIAAEN